MKPINEQEFEICEAPSIRESVGVVARAKTGLAEISRVFRLRYDTDRLTGRLRRDAGMDELDIERNQLAKAPLFR